MDALRKVVREDIRAVIQEEIAKILEEAAADVQIHEFVLNQDVDKQKAGRAAKTAAPIPTTTIRNVARDASMMINAMAINTIVGR